MAGGQHGLSYMTTALPRTALSHSATLLVTRERLAKTAKMIEFNGNCNAEPTTKEARFDIIAKLLSLGLEPVDVPADGNCFLHATCFSLLQLKDWNITLAPTVVMIRAEVVRFPTACCHGWTHT